MTRTSCWSRQRQRVSAPNTFLTVRSASCPLLPASSEVATPSLSQSKTPSQTSSSPSSREPSGQRPQPRTLAATCSPVSGSGSPWIISQNKEFQIFRNTFNGSILHPILLFVLLLLRYFSYVF